MSSPSRVAYLDGLRALGILAVLGVHWAAEYLPIGTGGYIGVDVFFVVSGYVITSVLWRGPLGESIGGAWVTFMKRRVRRLYPALLGLAILTPLAIAVVPGDPDVGVGHAAWNGLLAVLQLTWLPEILGTTTEPFRQTWSLAMEWYFYLLWPIAVYAARRAGWSATRLARWSAISGVPLYLVALPWGGLIFYAIPPARFAEILAGGVVALLAIDAPGPRRASSSDTAVTALFLALICAYVVAAPGHYYDPICRFVGVPLAVVGTVLLLRHGLTDADSPIKRLFTAAPLTLIGRTSYSLYLWHWLPIFLLDKDAIALPGIVLAVVGVAMAAGFTALSYRYLEKPFLGSQSGALQLGRREPATR
ncbi:hypothetical protein GCM10022215_04480 [Nocardioides fonticola]|uniref:Acyltransferase 3 domain-containing protein n=1 Tax=Nocardioides fonticola TaxID=450363 RepID=A0ABP7XBJ4_9ACTN